MVEQRQESERVREWESKTESKKKRNERITKIEWCFGIHLSNWMSVVFVPWLVASFRFLSLYWFICACVHSVHRKTAVSVNWVWHGCFKCSVEVFTPNQVARSEKRTQKKYKRMLVGDFAIFGILRNIYAWNYYKTVIKWETNGIEQKKRVWLCVCVRTRETKIIKFRLNNICKFNTLQLSWASRLARFCPTSIGKKL